MILFKKIFAMFLSGILIWPVISMEEPAISREAKEEKEVLKEDENTPHLSFYVVKSTDQVERISELTQDSPVVTGAVKHENDTWSLALGRTYVRHNTLRDTLEANGLAALREVLADLDKEDMTEPDEQEKTKDWQVLYLVRKGDVSGVTKWFVEGIGFIQGPWNSIPREKIQIPYIVTGLSAHARSCINHLESAKIKFVEVKVNKQQLKAVREVASKHYPRFLCMDDINVCFAGHSGLCRFAWDTALNKHSGFPANNLSYYGFTILGNVLNPNTGSLQRMTALKVHYPYQYNEVESKLIKLGFNIPLARE